MTFSPDDLIEPTSDPFINPDDIAAASTGPVVSEAAVEQYALSADQVREASRISLDFLAALIAPASFTYKFPSLLIAAWQLMCAASVKSRDFTKLVLGIPRGFAKTTLLKIFVVFCILFTPKKCLLIIGNTEAHAVNFLRDVCNMLDSTNIRTVFGNWRLAVERDTQTVKIFSFRGRTIVLAGIGAGTSLRGLNIDNSRPDLMLFDDIQLREQADSEQLSNDLLVWMIGTAMKAASPFGCTYIFSGNMYPTPHSILKKLKNNPEWTSFIVGGILADGTSLWEELKPLKQLLAEYRSDAALGHAEIFAAEILNDEHATSNNRLDLEKIPRCRFDLSEPEQGSLIIIDPSGDKNTSDVCAIGHIKVYDGVPVVNKLINGRFSPMETIQKALILAMRTQCSLIVVESVQYQASLLYWFEFVSEQYGITGIEFQPIYPKGVSKNARIMDAYKQLVRGEVQLSDEARPPVLAEYATWNPLRRDNVDNNLDIVAYAPVALAEYGHLMTLKGQLIAQEAELAKVEEFNTPF